MPTQKKFFDLSHKDTIDSIVSYIANIPLKGVIEDHGIGAYEFWGSPGVDTQLVLVPSEEGFDIEVRLPVGTTFEDLYDFILPELDEKVEELGPRHLTASQGTKTLESDFYPRWSTVCTNLTDEKDIQSFSLAYEWRE